MANRKTSVAVLNPHSDPVAAATHLYAGNLICLDSSGNAVAGSATTGLVARGVSQEEVDNSDGLAADKYVTTRSGVFLLANKSGDEVTKAEIGDVCYISTAIEVCKTSTGKSVAGIVKDVIDSQVAVAVGTWPLQVGLLAANNLSDVGSAATARANIGANVFEVVLDVEDLVGADATRYGFVAPRACVITSIRSVLLGHALATGDATLTGKIAGVAITSGVVTIAQTSSAIGDLDSASPSAANTATAGQFVEILVGGTNSDTDARASVTISGTC